MNKLVSAIFHATEWINRIVLNMVGRVEAWRRNIPEITAMCLYTVMHFAMCIFHEPWFDEAQAWQIARSAALKDILFRAPHYEGHTSLWDFILMPFARTGAPFELSLSVVSFLFAGTAVALILWKSPFPRLVRLLIPFTYFFFYQYGVICRVYCVMMLAFVLMAMFYKDRNERPGRYVLSMMLLAYIMPYGLLMTGAIALIWVIEIWDKRPLKAFLREAVRDKRMYWLLALLAGALLTIYQILPWPDTFAAAENLKKTELGFVKNGFLMRLLYTVVVMPADATVTTVWDDYQLLQYSPVSMPMFTAALLVGLLIWGILADLAVQKKTLPMLLLPYFAFSGFGAATYISTHHMGIAVLFALFFLWISQESETVKRGLIEKKLQGQDQKIVKNAVSLLLSASMAVSLVWTVGAVVTDIRYSYYSGRYEAKFMKELGLDQYTVLADWRRFYDRDGDVCMYDLNHPGIAVCIAPYFDHNIFCNLNHQREDMNYIEHRIYTDQEIAAETERLKGMVPDVIVGYPDMETIYGNELSLEQDYTMVFLSYIKKAWKMDGTYSMSCIFVKNELAEKLNLEAVELRTERSEWSKHPKPVTSVGRQ